MSSLREDAKRLFPTITLTLVSIVQALALQALLQGAFDPLANHGEGAAFALRMFQVGSVFLMLVIVWHEYVLGVVRFRYVVGLQDSLIPFVLGFSELGVIEATYNAPLETWFLWQALALAVGVWIYWHQAWRARRDPDAGDIGARHGRFTASQRVAFMVFSSAFCLASSLAIAQLHPSLEIQVGLVAALIVGQLGFGAVSARVWTTLTTA